MKGNVRRNGDLDQALHYAERLRSAEDPGFKIRRPLKVCVRSGCNRMIRWALPTCWEHTPKRQAEPVTEAPAGEEPAPAQGAA